MNSTGFNISNMPKSVTCYICGRGYGTKSISIHLKNCEKKWDVEQMQKPKNQRRPCPQAPKNFMDVISRGNITYKALEELNTKAFEEYNEIALEKCMHCNRTFNSESFKVHQRICSADKPFKPLKKQMVNQTEPIEVKSIGKSAPGIKKVEPQGIVKKPVQQLKGLEMTSNYVYNPIIGSKPQTINNKPQISLHNDFDDDFENDDEGDVNTNQDVGDLASCAKCGRNFTVDRISKHHKVCKVNAKPKKVKLFHKKQPNENKQPSEGKQKWKEQHEALVANMKYVRQIKKIEEQGGDIRKITPPPSMNHDKDYKNCPHCDRKFNENAYERHSKVCMNIVNKPQPLMRKDVNYGGAKAITTNNKVGINQRVRY